MRANRAGALGQHLRKGTLHLDGDLQCAKQHANAFVAELGQGWNRARLVIFGDVLAQELRLCEDAYRLSHRVTDGAAKSTHGGSVSR